MLPIGNAFTVGIEEYGLKCYKTNDATTCVIIAVSFYAFRGCKSNTLAQLTRAFQKPGKLSAAY